MDTENWEADMESTADFRSQLIDMIDERRPDKNNELLRQFADTLWQRMPSEDLQSLDVADAYGATLTAYRFFAHPDWTQDETAAGAARIQIINPEFEQDGWQSSHTVVLVLHKDMPFITDSILLELSHHELTTHNLQNMVFKPQRDNGNLVTLSGNAEGETLIYAAIDRINEGEFADLENRLGDVLAEVRQVVADFHPIQQKVRDLLDNMAQGDLRVPPQERAEADEFLHWLLDNHFTFLGYREFRINDGCVEQVHGRELGVLKLRKQATPRNLADMPERTRSFITEPKLLSFSKSGTRSRVHRHAYPDYVALKRFDENGNVIGECGFLGLYTSSVYNEHPRTIPVVARKVQRILERSGLNASGFDGKLLAQVLATYPRDELFQTSEDELFETTMAITRNHERSKVKLFVRAGRYGLFYSCLVYLPRELYNTQLRVRMQQMLVEAFGAIDAEFYSYISESILVRTQFILRVHPQKSLNYDVKELEAAIVDLTKDWNQELRQHLTHEYGEQRGRQYAKKYLQAFPSSYREVFSVRSAVYDVKHLDDLSEEHNLAMRFYRRPQDDDTLVHLKIYHLGGFLPLSDILPMLENLGLRAIEEHPYNIVGKSKQQRSIQDFYLSYGESLDLNKIGDVFEEAFIQIWYGDAENDSFNRLVLSTQKGSRKIAMLRAYARYMKQIRTGFSQEFIADTLLKHVNITRMLMDYFFQKFSPEILSRDLSHIADSIRQALEKVSLLNEDRILRRFLEFMVYTLRTNFYQKDSEGKNKSYISLKIDARHIVGIPEPKPEFEIFLYSPSVEGVHLRNGEFARGGLRWSDRHEDFRTEILGLVKAQTVKNAVIVPTGAKGGFICKRHTETREAFMEEGIRCYRQLVAGMLDLTDNLIQGKVVPPQDVVRYDPDDSYLVVAADKGTATFSDIANEIAETRGFWLGDAFASGGSHGYDHKEMAITAKGAWISVQRHFSELGVDVQTDPIKIIGIGDMSGDVFGNGMLLSHSVKLVAAFNHMHVFIDPDPDPETSFVERRRIFELSRSSWADYDESILSAGGGIFSRLQKAITITPEMQSLFDIVQTTLSPDELIHVLLKAPVDLIWNGGIGTYVKATDEADAEVGDRSNDALRINAEDLHCKVFGEGGNLGLTQKARIEFALNGGRVNTDFIDNSAGVDCSDHEVNIKILLNQQIQDGELTAKQRNKLLVAMTDEVAALVLHNNFSQAQALSLAERHSDSRLAEYIRLINTLESEQQLRRDLENIPTDEALLEREQQGQGLTRPELAVLLSYSKLHIKSQMLASKMDDYANLNSAVLLEFPESLRRNYSKQMFQHPLHREIIATQIANDVVHHMGLSFVSHLKEFVGGSCMEIVQAYDIMVEAFRIREYWKQLEQVDEMDGAARLDLQLNLIRLGRRATRWFLRHHRGAEDIENLVAHCQPCIDRMRQQQRCVLGDDAWQLWQAEVCRFIESGCPREIAEVCVNASDSAAALPIIEAAESGQVDVLRAAEVYAHMGQVLSFDWFSEQLGVAKAHSHWQAMERDALQDEFMAQRGKLTADVLRVIESDSPVVEAVEYWLSQRQSFVDGWHRVIGEAQRSGLQDFALYSMTSRKLGDLMRLL